MKKAEHTKSSKSWRKRLDGPLTFLIGFVVAAAVGLVLVNIFSDYIFDAVVNFVEL